MRTALVAVAWVGLVLSALGLVGGLLDAMHELVSCDDASALRMRDALSSALALAVG